MVPLSPPVFLHGKWVGDSFCPRKTNVQRMSHSCSSSVQHQVKRYSFLGLFFFCFFNLAPPANEWSELDRQVQISNRLQACPRAANTRGDGGRNVSQWTQEPSSQGEVALLSAGGGCEINTSSLLGVLCFSLALAPLLTHLLHWVGGPMGGK